MTEKITRRLFLKQMACGLTALGLRPQGVSAWLGAESFQRISTPRPDGLTSKFANQPRRMPKQLQAPISDEAIPTAFFYPGYTQGMLQAAWQNEDLVNGFIYGLIDTHTLGGIPDPSNVTVDHDGSAILTIRRATEQQLAEWQADPDKWNLILQARKNKLEMNLSVAVFTGRLPTDLQSIEASITLPQRIVTGDPKKGMSGIGWALWTLPDYDRLEAMLSSLGVSAEENLALRTRVSNYGLEEDIAEFGLGAPSAEWGDPLLLQILNSELLLCMAGRKTATAKCLRADIMHVLYEPIDFSIPAQLTDRTIRGWLRAGDNFDQVLKQPLKMKLEVASPIYDPTRNVMVAPMDFRLNDKLLNPTALGDYPGFENDTSGRTAANLSVWQIRTSLGDWVTIPRKFTISFCSTTRSIVIGETDSIRFSNVIITRRASNKLVPD